MSESPQRMRHHIELHTVLPPDRRDLYRATDESVKSSWRNDVLGDEQKDVVGRPGSYFVDLTPSEALHFESASNCKYALPVIEAEVQGDMRQAEVVRSRSFAVVRESERRDFPAGEESFSEEMPDNLYSFPEAASMRYHNAHASEVSEQAGEGYLIWHLDTGVSKVIEDMTPAGVIHRKSYVGEDTYDRVSGHGSASASIAVPIGTKLSVHEVLGHDGRGGSDGITAAIRGAAEYAKANPRMFGKIVLTGSLGSFGPPFQPYNDACRIAEENGVLCLFSAGNDGKYGLGRPSNWREDRASIAFVKESDRRASFSNYHESAAGATDGNQCLVISRDGRLLRMSGTSFSLPFLVRHVTVLAWEHQVSVFKAFRAILSTMRDSPEPMAEEANGVMDYRAASRKLLKVKRRKND